MTSTAAGRIDIVELPRDGEPRTVRIFVPPGYGEDADPFPVLYMFDGHNLFDVATATYDKEWRIDKTLMALIEAGLSRGALVVGLDAPHGAHPRYAEYTAWDWTHHHGHPISATGAATLAFLTDVVMPHVEGSYRVRRDREGRGIAGSSMGGYMTIYTATSRPDLFATALAFSPVTLEWPMAGHRLRQHVQDVGVSDPVRFYLDMGTAEELEYVDAPADLVANMHEMADCIETTGHSEVLRREISDAPHDEDAWAARFGEVFLWAFEGGELPGLDQ